jgi:hypothetical protein
MVKGIAPPEGDPLRSILTPHPSAPLEYWFFKVNHRGIALLVDWIARRKVSTGHLRISIHSPMGRQVLHTGHPTILRHGAAELSMQETSWLRGDVRWHLALAPSSQRIRPQLFAAEQLKLFDMSLESSPRVAFTGWIEHRGTRFSVDHAPGMISHYWGRALPQEWWWISATRFEDPPLALECMALRSRVWGTSASLSLGYLYFRDRSDSRLLISPPARLTVSGTPEAFEIAASARSGPRFALKATGRDYASFDEGIVNTLVGDLEVWQEGHLLSVVRGTAGLERRS